MVKLDIKKKNITSIYVFKKNLHKKEVNQGDVFKNLPYYTHEILRTNTISLDNAAEKILSNIIKKNEPILVESIINPTWAILASQSCDIRDNYNLLFFPIVKTKIPEDSLIEFIDKKMREKTRRIYLPKIILNEQEVFGPFEVLFQNPFVVPYNVIVDDLNSCWVAHIKEPARKIFIGKLTEFYSRTPMDEWMFLENDQMEKFIQYKWKEVWKPNVLNQKEIIRNILEMLCELKITLFSVNRLSDFKSINIIDQQILERIDKLLFSSNFFKETNKGKKHYDLIKNKKTTNYIASFYDFLDGTLLKSDSEYSNLQILHNKLKKDDNFSKKYESNNFLDIPSNIRKKKTFEEIQIISYESLTKLSFFKDLASVYIEFKNDLYI